MNNNKCNLKIYTLQELRLKSVNSSKETYFPKMTKNSITMIIILLSLINIKITMTSESSKKESEEQFVPGKDWKEIKEGKY